MTVGPVDIGALIWGASFLICIFFAVEILRSLRPEQSIAAWLLLFLLVPPAGGALYLLFGRRKLRQRAEEKPSLEDWAPSESPPIDRFDSLIRSYGLPPAAEGNQVIFRGTGQSAYATVVDLIEHAQHSLWITTYILSADPIGRDIVRRLAAKAASGVQVRLLIDDVGSPDARDGKLVAPLIAAGGAVARFMPISFVPRSRHYSNLRNHRKIIVADQRRAWSGGMNLSELYLGSPSVPGFFHDLSFVVTGSAAAVYSSTFASDWAFSADEKLHLDPASFRAARAPATGVVQVVPAGPEVEGDPVYDVILTMVHQAERSLWVVSPYFVPDIGLMRAFVLAARRGVDVRVLTDFASDLPLVDFACVPYLRTLAQAGGRVLRFKEGMLHAKAVVMDDRIAFAGTTNLDQRSLFLNFEIMAMFYGEDETAEIKQWMEGFFDRCTEDLPPATPLRQITEGFVRLFAPIL